MSKKLTFPDNEVTYPTNHCGISGLSNGVNSDPYEFVADNPQPDGTTPPFEYIKLVNRYVQK